MLILSGPVELLFLLRLIVGLPLDNIPYLGMLMKSVGA